MFDYDELDDIGDTMENAANTIEENDYEVNQFLATMYGREVSQYSSEDSPEEAVESLATDVEDAFRPEVVVSPVDAEHPDDKVSVTYSISEDYFHVHGARSNVEDAEEEIEGLLEESGFEVR